MRELKRWRVGVPAALLVLAIAAAGCGDDDDNATPGATASASGDAALGKENKATGTPIKVAFFSEGKATTIDNTEEVNAAKAAAQYVNNYLGGIAGHPIDLVVCELKANPATAKSCANRALQANVIAATSGPTGQLDPTIDVISPSGVPFFLSSGATTKANQSPNVYVMTNGIGILGGVPAKFAKDNGITKAAVVTIDVPAAIGPVSGLAKLVFGNAGVTADVVGIAPGVPDHSPRIQAALAKKPGMFEVIGDSAFCTSTLKAMRQLAVKVPIIVIPQCIGDGNAAQIPDGFTGIQVVGTFTLDPTDPDVKLFKAVMTKYSNGDITGTAPTGYQAVLGFYYATKGLTGDVTSASIKTAISTMEKQPLPLGGPGGTFQCGKKVVQIAPNICTPEALLGTADKDGNVTGVKVVDAGALLVAPPKK